MTIRKRHDLLEVVESMLKDGCPPDIEMSRTEFRQGSMMPTRYRIAFCMVAPSGKPRVITSIAVDAEGNIVIHRSNEVDWETLDLANPDFVTSTWRVVRQHARDWLGT